MVTGWARTRTMVLAIALAGTGLAALPQAASAQDAEARLRKIEAEIKALQRQVFPGGDGRFFTPEVITPTPGTTTGGAGAGASTSAVTDILGRLDSLESQLARLTAQTEENTHAVAQLAVRVDDIEKARAAEQAPALPADPLLGGGTVPAPSGGAQFAAVPSTANPAPRPASQTPAPRPTPAPVAVPTPAPSPAASGPTAARLAAVQAIAKPTTDDAGDDEYSYGFRLWDAKFYPEAQQQLGLFVQKYPSHWRMSYARNLLGRAYMDDGKPRDAAQWFLQNYQQDKTGERAADSLLYLAEAMITIKDTNRACLALAEFSEVYPAIATGRLQAQYQADVAKVKCTKG
ncbi:hypothetical protein SZ64_16495 [Erythrobacter sp. SG61-1L]|nr:hypothetical protein SZ64_16495 [Erythrobacter sp. SG61-1L]